MRIALYSIPMFLLLAAGAAQAQANRIPADRTPTSGVTETPTLPPRISTSPATDSVMAGGDAVPLPGGQWDMGVGGTPPPPVPGPGGAFGFPTGDYVWDSTRLHNAGLTLWLTLSNDGTWKVEHQLAGLPRATDNTGNWAATPSPTVGSGYVVTVTWVPQSVGAEVGTDSCPVLAPFYGGTGPDPLNALITVRYYNCGITATTVINYTTGEVSLAAPLTFRASPSAIIGGSPANSGGANLDGAWKVTIRNIATGVTATDTINFRLETHGGS